MPFLFGRPNCITLASRAMRSLKQRTASHALPSWYILLICPPIFVPIAPPIWAELRASAPTRHRSSTFRMSPNSHATFVSDVEQCAACSYDENPNHNRCRYYRYQIYHWLDICKWNKCRPCNEQGWHDQANEYQRNSNRPPQNNKSAHQQNQFGRNREPDDCQRNEMSASVNLTEMESTTPACPRKSQAIRNRRCHESDDER